MVRCGYGRSWNFRLLEIERIIARPLRLDGIMRNSKLFAITALGISCTSAFAGFYSTNVTQLMRGALQGQNVATPVPAAELYLLHQGELIYHQAFGATTLNSVYNVDSSSKTLSGAVMMSLVDSSPNAFSLDTKLSDYIPSFDGDMTNITIRQAFSHSSGLPGSEAGPALTNPNITLQQSAALIAAGNYPNGPAGTKFAYGGLSMQAAGAVAELAGAQPFVQLMQNRILDPLAMTHTRFGLASATNPRIAGGIESSAADFGTFMEMLRNDGQHNGHQVLSAASVAQMFTRQTAGTIEIVSTPLDGSADYGIGVWLPGRDQQGNLTGALAAGARGFHSWIDFENDVVGVFATDSTSGSNVVPLGELINAEVALQLANPILDGDANVDGTVNITDFAFLAFNFNRVNLTWEQGDFTGDGVTNINDFALLAGNFNQSTPTMTHAAVPETAWLPVVALAFAARRRRPSSAHPSNP